MSSTPPGLQGIHAILLHHGAPAVAGGLLGLDNRRRLEAGEGLSAAGREAVAAALRVLDALDAELDPLRAQITAFAARQPGCRAFQADYAIGPITATALWSELGDSRRFSASVRRSGIPGWTSPCTPWTASGRPGACPARDRCCCAGRCSRPPSALPARVLPITPATGRSPIESAAIGPPLSVARKMLRRAHHTLRALGDQALAPV